MCRAFVVFDRSFLSSCEDSRLHTEQLIILVMDLRASARGLALILVEPTSQLPNIDVSTLIEGDRFWVR